MGHGQAAAHATAARVKACPHPVLPASRDDGRSRSANNGRPGLGQSAGLSGSLLGSADYREKTCRSPRPLPVQPLHYNGGVRPKYGKTMPLRVLHEDTLQFMQFCGGESIRVAVSSRRALTLGSPNFPVASTHFSYHGQITSAPTWASRRAWARSSAVFYPRNGWRSGVAPLPPETRLRSAASVAAPATPLWARHARRGHASRRWRGDHRWNNWTPARRRNRRCRGRRRSRGSARSCTRSPWSPRSHWTRNGSGRRLLLGRGDIEPEDRFCAFRISDLPRWRDTRHRVDLRQVTNVSGIGGELRGAADQPQFFDAARRIRSLTPTRPYAVFSLLLKHDFHHCPACSRRLQ